MVTTATASSLHHPTSLTVKSLFRQVTGKSITHHQDMVAASQGIGEKADYGRKMHQAWFPIIHSSSVRDKHHRISVTGYQRQKQKKKIYISRKSVRQLRGSLALNSPCFQCNGEDLQSHDECCEAHAHSEGEHRIKLIVFHRFDDISGLSIGQKGLFLSQDIALNLR